MPTIDVTDTVWTYLLEHAHAPDETPSAVLERLLGLRQAESPPPSDGDAPAHPQGAFREPILHVLTELGGRAPKRAVLARLAKLVALTDADYARNLRGQRRWERRIASAAAAMKRDGLLTHTQHGVWALATPRSETYANQRSPDRLDNPTKPVEHAPHD